jgi:heme exporter protein D
VAPSALKLPRVQAQVLAMLYVCMYVCMIIACLLLTTIRSVVALRAMLRTSAGRREKNTRLAATLALPGSKGDSHRSHWGTSGLTSLRRVSHAKV